MRGQKVVFSALGTLALGAAIVTVGPAAPAGASPREAVPGAARSAELAAALPPAAVSGAAEERVTAYDITVTVHGNGSLHVRERIVYDFGDTDRHGITRTIPVRERYDDVNDRLYPLSSISVSSPSGAPADVRKSRESPVELRIGDPDRTVTGEQTYLIDYDVAGAVTTLPDRQEVRWDIVGSEWDVPIGTVTSRVEVDAPITRAACFQGPPGSTRTCPASTQAGAAVFEAGPLAPGTGATVEVVLPAGALPYARPPVLVERWSLRTALEVTPATVGGMFAVLLLLGGGVTGMVWRRGRDDGARQGNGEVAPAPPDGVRPGELGTVLLGRAMPLHITATIVDLAVREFLRIEEVRPDIGGPSTDWRLVRLTPAPVDQLREYERVLYEHLLPEGQDTVLLSSLKQHFLLQFQQVKALLEQDVADRGWFRGTPSESRLRCRAGVSVGVIAAGILAMMLVVTTHAGLVGLAAFAGMLPSAVLMWWVPGRTAAGSAVRAGGQAFGRYLATVEADRLVVDGGEARFGPYLPYAVALGYQQRWTWAFAQLAEAGRAVPDQNWYTTTDNRTFGRHYGELDRGMSIFTTTALTTVTSSEPSFWSSSSSSSSSSSFSSSSGSFSGGGGGGGGGGSW